VVPRLREAYGLYRLHAGDVPARVSELVGSLAEDERVIEREFGFELRGRRLLDVGAGQGLFQLAYFSRRNEVVGIDLEVIAQGASPVPYVRMLRSNGVRRTVKTVGRKLLGVDARYRAELTRQLGLRRFPRLRVLPMDACAMSFPDGSFEVVYSHSVFQHLPEPERGLEEVKRVLAPGGVAHLSFHLYTSDTGSLDPRLMRGAGEQLPLWAHLRPGLEELVLQNAYLNRLRLPQWRELLQSHLPGCRLLLYAADRERLEAEARRLQAAGQLRDYQLDELTTRRIVALWQKPATPGRGSH
jgi:SAM-dependent methyltransferase